MLCITYWIHYADLLSQNYTRKHKNAAPRLIKKFDVFLGTLSFNFKRSLCPDDRLEMPLLIALKLFF